MRKILPAALTATTLTLTILLTGCANTPATTPNTPTASPTPYSTTPIVQPQSALGDSNISIPQENFNKDGSFKTPTVDIAKATPPATASPEYVKTYTDFKTIITNSVNKMLETGATQTQTQGGTSATYVIVKTSPTTYKAAAKFSNSSKAPDLLQTINMYIPSIAETSLNSPEATYSINGNQITVTTKIGTYVFGITDGLITSLNITGSETVKTQPYTGTIVYSTDANAQQIADTAVLPPY